MPVEVKIDDGPEERWSMTIRGTAGNLTLTRDELSGDWLDREILIPGEVLRRPVEDLIEIGRGRPAFGATISEAVEVLDTIEAARMAAGVPRRPGWKRPRAKALGRLNGSC